MGVGVTTNYQPAQPIAFSHEIHAELMVLIVIIVTLVLDIVNIQVFLLPMYV